MINTLTRAAKLAPLLAAGAIFATAALAQAPSQAQRDAIKAQCRSDYMAHCSSVPPGGEASLQCLQKNMSSLSSSCQSAVRAVEAPAAPAATTAKPAEAAPAKSAAPAAATTAAPKSAEPKATAAQPTSAQASAIRSACRSDDAMIVFDASGSMAAQRRCNAWKRSRLKFRQLAATPSQPPAAVLRRPPRLQRHLRRLAQRPPPRRPP